ncbi:MAG: GGDEF domain-containing protein, partial [Candidatus Eremiobacteraeota bacterium]|nr:GGDEF domain-containing protein [Candidatus Eremiobacteraeota bacterium]
MLLLDLDGFKRVNDSAGHAVGDVLLVQVAERLQHATRGCDLVARLGGDEFAVLLNDVHANGDLITVAERIVGAIARPFTVQETVCVVGVSVGIARGADTDASVDALMRNADLALYEAKARGKGQHAFFDPDMHVAAVERVALEAALRSGL